MQSAPFKKIAAPAAEIVARASLSKPARKLLGDGDGAPAYLAKLLDAGMLGDAVKFLAHGLPKRECTWLACLAARATLPAEPEPEAIRALEAAERWVFKPGEESRQAAMTEANAPDRDPTPAQLAASAAAWSGGSLAPPDAPEVPPGDFMTPTAVYTALITAAYAAEPERAEAKLRRFVDQAVDIANGGSGRLDRSPPAAS
jgi:hypothetical protein